MFKFTPKDEYIDLDGYLSHKSKVCIKRRKANGKVYDSPQIILDSRFKAYIGKRYMALQGGLHRVLFPILTQIQFG